MKKISILIPCYNEEKNVVLISKKIIEIFNSKLPSYDYELIFIDNCSTDNTRNQLRNICKTNNKIKAIFNIKNFGQFNSPVYGICQTSGCCTITLCADFQDPIELIPKFIDEWEKGYKIVIGIKHKSKENKFIRMLRTIYYKTIRKISNIDMIEHFTGFGLYDRIFIDILKDLKDPIPFLRGIVAEFGFKRKEIYYEQAKRRSGKSHNDFFTLYDAAMLSFTAYTKSGIRIATFLGFLISLITFFIGVIYLFYKIIFWERFSVGMAPVIIGVFFTSALQLFFIGFIGEYIMAVNTRIMNRPLVIEEERINFD